MPIKPAPEEIKNLGLTMKAEVRKSLTRTRAMMPVDQRTAASRAIVERVLALPEWESARTVALFKPIVRKGEVDTTALHEAARAAGKRVAYPIIEGDEPLIEDCAMGFRFVEDLRSFADQGRGFPEPPRAGEPVTELDFILVPGLAFDPTGYRLGYGAGLYDRSLPRFPTSKTVGVAFDFQVLMELPRGEHDVPVQVIVTDRRVIRREHE